MSRGQVHIAPRAPLWKTPVMDRVREALKRNLRKYLEISRRDAAEVSRTAGQNQWYIANILSGKSGNPHASRLRHIAAVLGRTLDDLYADNADETSGRPVLLRYRAASAHAASRPDVLAPSGGFPAVFLPPSIRSQDDDFAVDLCDDSADQLRYRSGDVLICRPVSASHGQVELGKHTVVRFPPKAAADEPDEILVGQLDRSSSGELLLTIRSSRRDLFSPKIIQGVIAPEGQFTDAQIVSVNRGESISYVPRPEDEGEILGQVVASIKSEGA